jgi:tRNA(fMet)-specific endonuclease VapC
MENWKESLPFGVPVLLDTVIILQIIRNNDVGAVIDWTFHISEHWEDFFVAAITVGELLTLTRRNNWSGKKRLLLDQVLRNVQVLNHLTQPVIESYTELSLTATKRGRSIGQNDLWIAAFAKTYDMVLLTLDHDFDGIENELYELRVIDY